MSSKLNADPFALENPSGLKLSGEAVPVYAIIPAAGTGSRMGAGRNKQYLEVGGIPLVVRTLLAFEKCQSVIGYIVVVSPNEKQAMAALLQGYDLTKLIGLADGGDTRQDSVLAGLRLLKHKIEASEQAMVLVHDGARCFVPQAVIRRCIDAVEQRKAACGAAVPVKDTIKEAELDGRVCATLNRSRLWAMQTPQGAMLLPLLAAYEQLESNRVQVTDDLAVMEAVGQQVYLVEGDYTNIKMTTPEDLVIGEALAIHADI